MSERHFHVLPAAERPRTRREAARVLMISDGHVLLFADSDPSRPEFAWWVTPGGGLDPGESPRQAAVREVWEETGYRAEEADLIGPVATRRAVHGYGDEILDQDETFFLLDVARFDVDESAHTDVERITLRGSRWWPLAELADPPVWVWPARLLDLVAVARSGGEPLSLGRETEESTMPVEEFDAIILGGGRGLRLGGVSKPDVQFGGRRLIERAVDACTGARRSVAVVAETVALPPGALRAREDPPLGGPVAGIAAGLARLGDEPVPAELVVVLACDLAGAGTLVPRLVARLAAAPAEVDGIHLRVGERDHWLGGCYRRASVLRALGGDSGHGRSVRDLLAGLCLQTIGVSTSRVRDLNTPIDLVEPG